jgi:hypothetical protein
VVVSILATTVGRAIPPVTAGQLPATFCVHVKAQPALPALPLPLHAGVEAGQSITSVRELVYDLKLPYNLRVSAVRDLLNGCA